mgnify:FL=1
MNDTFEKHMLTKVFMEKAEKADTLEQKILFCESFLKKYKKQKVTNDIYRQEYETTFPVSNNAAGNSILNTATTLPAHSYSATYITGPKQEIFKAQKITMGDRLLSSEDKMYMVEKIKQELITEIMNNVLKCGYVTYDIQKNYGDDSTSIRCKLGVFKA